MTPDQAGMIALILFVVGAWTIIGATIGFFIGCLRGNN